MNRAGITSENWWRPEAWRTRFAERYTTLHERFGDAPASRMAEALVPFILYVERCTNEQHRLFLAGFMPEVAYYARRAFAGGGYEHYNFNSPINQQRVVERMRRQLVPFVLIPAADDETLAVDLPILAGYVRERYVPLTDVLVHEGEHVRILVDQGLQPTSRDAETGWPCFT